MSGPVRVQLGTPGRIGTLATRTRLVRAGTSETMGTTAGEPTGELVGLYETLARSGLGLILTGHLYCHPRGQYAVNQAGMWSDDHRAAWRQVTDAVHRHGVPIFGQVAHAGSQSRVPGVDTLAPSSVPNALTGRPADEMTGQDIDEAIDAFAQSARRMVAAGFDGVHIHGANGYLISEFCSPVTNRRNDHWGGNARNRDRFALEVVRTVRKVVPVGTPVTMKLGVVDAVPGGLDLDESVPRAGRLVEAGLDALEISSNIMQLPTDSARRYVAVDRRRAAGDLLLHRLHKHGEAEAYFVPWVRAVRAHVDTTLIGVGGMRRVETMNALLAEGTLDFVAMARPLIREPDLAAQIASGRTGRVDCTSCNICLSHEGHHSLRCWRTPRRRLVQHAIYRARGGLG